MKSPTTRWRTSSVPAAELGSFDFASRTAKRHRTEIRAHTGFRECSVADAEALAGWLAEHVASGERRPERVRDELILRCRVELIEPPTPERMSEIARSALHQGAARSFVRKTWVGPRTKLGGATSSWTGLVLG